MFAHVRVHVYIYVCVFVHVRVHVYIYVCEFVHMSVFVGVCALVERIHLIKRRPSSLKRGKETSTVRVNLHGVGRSARPTSK